MLCLIRLLISFLYLRVFGSMIVVKAESRIQSSIIKKNKLNTTLYYNAQLLITVICRTY